MRKLFPTVDKQLTYRFDYETTSDELLLADGDRLVQTYNGATYVTWHIRSDGVFRAAPGYKGPAATTPFLRYLPAQLVDGLTWQQTAGNETYLFELTERPLCPFTTGKATCWQLGLFSRHENTTFVFAEEMGVVQAESINLANQAESFAKKIDRQGAVRVSAEARQRYLRDAIPWSNAAQTFPEAITRQQLRAAVNALYPDDTVVDLVHDTPFPRKPGACTPTGNGRPILAVRLLSADWRIHPDGKGPGLVVPTVTFTACNVGGPTTKGAAAVQFQLPPTSGDNNNIYLSVSNLEPGDQIGPIRLYGDMGVSRDLFDLWQKEPRYWPVLQVTGDATGQVSRVLGGTGGTAGPVPAPQTPAEPLPGNPPLDLLRRFAVATVAFDGMTAYLYDPGVRYMRHRSIAQCDNRGEVVPTGSQLGVYLSKAGGAPVKVADLGSFEWKARSGISAERQAALGVTFLYIDTANCKALHMNVLAYDHKTGELFRPQRQTEGGQVEAAWAGARVQPDGKVVESYGDGAETQIYQWDGDRRMFRFVNHTKNR